ncbi:sialidase family protein [Corynebacterium tapiri]|nr:sialidase family protein [Corynebacterium tapiri]
MLCSHRLATTLAVGMVSTVMLYPVPAHGAIGNSSPSSLGLSSLGLSSLDDQDPGYGFDADPQVEGEFTRQTLAVSGEGYDCYRIPALAVSPRGSVIASYDGRPGSCADAPNPNDIVQRVSTDNGATFGSETVVAKGDPSTPEGFSDPSLIVNWHTGTVHNIHVRSLKAGIAASVPGTDPDQKDAIHVNHARSFDDGQTWQHRLITSEVSSPEDRGRFATSGNGIQLHYGEHRGRLVQPAMTIQEDGTWAYVAWYSDDFGITWSHGQPFGHTGDENKIVELSDGRLMMNGRVKGEGTTRVVSYSDDGGETWTEPVADPNLPDPRNNASVIRAFPNAPQGSKEAKVLLFSNTASTTERNHGTIRMSCDDGQTWPVSKEFHEGPVDYTSMATLPDGRIGMLWEDHADSYSIVFSTFSLSWLGSTCLE